MPLRGKKPARRQAAPRPSGRPLLSLRHTLPERNVGLQPGAEAAITRAMSTKPLVAVVMGSKNDWETMHAAGKIFDEFGIA